ncbi:MAG: helix-turn-helix domain-containing protein [Williamsia sp.]|nr:helix-turn-helix domain-containing protein [Williamsia sp.]
MLAQPVYTLVNQQNGNLSFKIFAFDNTSYFDHIQRNNYFTIIIITDGKGMAKVDFCEYAFGADTLFAFYPYQPFMLTSTSAISGFAIQFHHDFFCIYRHHKEIASNGILFNNIYQQPFISLHQNTRTTLVHLVDEIIGELKTESLQRDEMIVSYLKILLVHATRIKMEQQSGQLNTSAADTHIGVVQNLKAAIEENFRLKHSAGDYAMLLNLSLNALARITKNHFNKTLSDLIAERIIIEAKRELYLTNKTVKEIAYELGYDDEYYFSRFFKAKTDVSPQLYRDTIGFNRGGS